MLLITGQAVQQSHAILAIIADVLVFVFSSFGCLR